MDKNQQWTEVKGSGSAFSSKKFAEVYRYDNARWSGAKKCYILINHVMERIHRQN